MRGSYLRLVICALALSLFGLTSANAEPFQIVVDTSSLSGVNGFLDLQFNPADIGAPSATASVTSFIGSISLLQPAEVAGNVSGALPGTLTFGNSDAFNDYFQAVHFGDTIRFVVDLGGDVLNHASTLGTSFALALYANDQVTPLLSSDTSGSLIRFDLSATGITAQTFSAAAQVSSVPLPAAFWLLLSGLGLLRFHRRR